MNKDTQWSLPFRYVAGVLYFLVFVAFLFYAHDAVRNLVIAAFIAYLISPAVDYLARRMRISHMAAVNVVYFSALVLLVGVPVTLMPLFYDEVQIVIQDVLNLFRQLSTTLSHPVHIGNLVFHLEAWGQNLSQMQSTVLTPLPEEVLKFLESTSVGTLWFLVILVSVYLFLSQWDFMRERLFSLVLPTYRYEVDELYKRVRRIWMAYLRGQIVLMVVVGIVFTIAWSIIGIPGALVLGMIAGLFTLVPDVGPFLAALLATGVALLEGSSWISLANYWVAAIVFGVYLVLIGMKNVFLRPIIMGRSVHMNEGIVFIAIIIATILEGILGALLIVPVLASFVVIAGYLQRKILGMSAFEGDGSNQFVAAPEMINPPRGRMQAGRKNTLDQAARSNPSLPASNSQARSKSKTTHRKKSS